MRAPGSGNAAPTVSVWAKEAGAAPSFPTCQSDQNFDVVVIGAGFTGLSAAYHLKEKHPSLSIAVLEAHTVGSGASGRNGGLVLNFIPGVDAAPEQAAEQYGVTRDAIDALAALIAKESFPDVLSRRGAMRVLTTQASADAARTRVDALNKLGVPLTFLGADDIQKRLAVSGCFGAVFDPNAGRLNGLLFTRALAGLLARRGVKIFERSPVEKIQEGAEILVKTPAATLRAGAIVLGTNAWTPSLGYFKSGIIPLHSLVVASDPVGESTLSRLGWGDCDGFSDDRARLSYCSLSPGGRIVFGGGNNASYQYRFGGQPGVDTPPTAKNFDAIARVVGDYFPGAREFAYPLRWSGPLALTMSRVCTIGVRGAHKTSTTASAIPAAASRSPTSRVGSSPTSITVTSPVGASFHFTTGR